MSIWFLKSFSDFANLAVAGREFHGAITLCENESKPLVVPAGGTYILPSKFRVIYLVGAKVKRVSTSMLSIPLIILNICIRSPLSLLPFNE